MKSFNLIAAKIGFTLIHFIQIGKFAINTLLYSVSTLFLL